MKKVLLLVLAVVFLTACGNKKEIVCTARVGENEGERFSVELIGKLDDDGKVILKDFYFVFDTEKELKEYCEEVNAQENVHVECSGKKAKVLSQEDNMSQEDFIKKSEEAGYTCK